MTRTEIIEQTKNALGALEEIGSNNWSDAERAEYLALAERLHTAEETSETTRSEYRQALACYFRTARRLRGTLIPISEHVTELALIALDAADESTRWQVDSILNWMHR